jgi:hypothetical protein
VGDTLEAIRIVTRCTTREQFVAMFNRYCTPTSCFIPSADTRDIGTATAFSIRLADGSILLRGEGVVLDAWSHGDHKFKRPGILLGIHKLDEPCSELFEQLNHPRSEAVPIPTQTQLQMLLAKPSSPVAELETPTVEMPPLKLPEEPRIPGSPHVLPANPLTEMTDDLVAQFVECNLVGEDVLPPVLPDGATTDVIPVEIPPDPTVPNKRDVIATILGVAPLQKQVFAAPELIVTEGVDRFETPRSLMRTPVQRPLTAPEPLMGVVDVAPDVVAITYSPAVAVPRTITPIDTLPKATPTSMRAVEERPRQRLRISAIGVAPITQITRGGRNLRQRFARRVMPVLRRWWLPATVATTIVATTITAVLIV